MRDLTPPKPNIEHVGSISVRDCKQHAGNVLGTQGVRWKWKLRRWGTRERAGAGFDSKTRISSIGLGWETTGGEAVECVWGEVDIVIEVVGAGDPENERGWGSDPPKPNIEHPGSISMGGRK
jgi:hypothetical protein